MDVQIQHNSQIYIKQSTPVQSKGGKNGLCVAFSSLLSWRLTAVCSLAPLCGSFLTVQPFLHAWRRSVQRSL